MDQSLSNKTIAVLSAILLVATIFLYTWAIGTGSLKEENCWDKYSTEQEAIMHCEEH